jgi:hypothetical protein
MEKKDEYCRQKGLIPVMMRTNVRLCAYIFLVLKLGLEPAVLSPKNWPNTRSQVAVILLVPIVGLGRFCPVDLGYFLIDFDWSV